MPLVATRGAASAQGFGEFAQSAAPVYIEDVFSTWLYTGNGSTQTITNGIDLSGKGGLVWIKSRSQGANYFDNVFYDTARGVQNALASSGPLATAGTQNNSGGFTGVDLYQFTNSGFSLGTDATFYKNTSADPLYASWTFRKQPKFFDVVTYTGNGVSGRTVAHNLGSAPGCVIIKSTSDAFDWYVYHQSLGAGNFLNLNLTAAATASEAMFGPGNPAPSSTVITLGNSNATNGNGKTYVAYLFAHNAGGFGLTGTDNVISCGAYTGNGSASGPVVTLNYEPQWLIIKKIGGSGGAWWMADTMRGFDNTSDQFLWANSSTSEIPKTNYVKPTATGFQIVNTDFDVNEAGANYIYIAIRRGPMKTPTTSTSVFKPTAYTGNGSTTTINAGFPIDLSMTRIRGVIGQTLVVDRLRGASQRLFTDSTTAESTSSTAVTSLASNTSITFGANGDTNSSGQTYVTWDFQRAPGFFDVVCFNATARGGAVPLNVSHNLTVAPELIILRSRSSGDWYTYDAATGATQYMLLNSIGTPLTGSGIWADTAPTQSVFTVGGSIGGGENYVAYLFASCPGVSKVGSYSGTGATQTISCGFAARFVLIKRTNSTGSWFVWDTARGMVAGTDPRLALNSTAAETNANWVYTNASGFQIVTTDATVNASGGSYIFLAIA